MVSRFPPTYDNTQNGLRADLMQKIAALHPGYLRVPGGNYLEGQTLATYFNWKATIGPIQDRPGHQNTAWGYWSQGRHGPAGVPGDGRGARRAADPRGLRGLLPVHPWPLRPEGVPAILVLGEPRGLNRRLALPVGR
jgi:hypothetical protein